MAKAQAALKDRSFLAGALAWLLAVGLLGLGVNTVRAQQPTPIVASGSDVSAVTEYRIGPLDRLNITVFQVEALSLQRAQVDAGGRIEMPLIGQVQAAGRTPRELSDEIATRLRGRYLRTPQVTVVVDQTASQKITVQGAVNEPGVFDMRGRTSLLEAVALAKGVNRTANLRRVAVVRSVNGQPSATIFDLQAIQEGRARNPEVVASDVIIVDNSRSRQMWRNLVEALPALAIFSYF